MKPVTNSDQLSRIVLKGYKSIQSCELDMGAINVLVGCNGAGKTNFISFFRMLDQIFSRDFQLYVAKQGMADAILHFGRKVTPSLRMEVYVGESSYVATLSATRDNRLIFDDERLVTGGNTYLQSNADDKFETAVVSKRYLHGEMSFPFNIRQMQIFHFHDTSETARVKQSHGIHLNSFLWDDAGNLGAFLYRLREKYNDSYQQIVKTVQLVAPFFGDFHLLLDPLSEKHSPQIHLEWLERGRDIPFLAHQLSDGTLRFICLTTVLLQPDELQPATIIIDEPELGLHPYALSVLGALIRSTAKRKQVIISTQSVELLNEFDAEDVIVVDRKDGCSTFERLDQENLSEWLKDYSLGELWKKNVLGGRPAR